MLHLNLMILLPLMYAVALYPIQIVTRPVYLIAVARHNQPHTAALPVRVGCLASYRQAAPITGSPRSTEGLTSSTILEYLDASGSSPEILPGRSGRTPDHGS
jgi:hypothetical protein